jgi:N-methylhydantoinase A
MGAGVVSALGFLVAAPSIHDVRGYLAPLSTVDWAHVNRLFATMEGRARGLLSRAGANRDEIVVEYSADMRYVGQGFEIPVRLPSGELGEEQLGAVREGFSRSYQERFDRVVTDVPVEVVNWRLAARSPGQQISLAREPIGTAAARAQRSVYFPGFGEMAAAVYDRYALAPGTRLKGPAVFEERESSCSVGPDCQVSIDTHFNLIVDFQDLRA